MTTASPELREKIAHTIRFLSVDAVEQAKSGHPGAPMGLATAALELWDGHLRFDPGDPSWALRDRFVLSAGHASMLLYSLLHLFGYDVSLDDLRRFRQLGARTPGHPEYGDTPGVETTTGPLGQGFANGVGMALAGQMTRARFGGDGDGPGQHFVYGIVSDGDLMEGISAEAGSLAGHLGLGNLIYLYDDNRITIDGATDITFTEDVAARFGAQRWQVQQVDGEDSDGLRAAIGAAREDTERPSLIVMRTTIGYGSPNLAGTSKTHGAPLGPEESAATKAAAGWPDTPFHIPDDVSAYLSERVAAKRAGRAERDARFEAWQGREPARAEAYASQCERALPADLVDRLAADWGKAATRVHSGEALNRVAADAPFLVGGSADLAASNNSRIGNAGDVATGDFAGRNIHFGVREHAMGAIANGIALDGTFAPYAGTFLVFSDYMRPSIRLAALSELPAIFVFTHDSVFGEDGPTHQPIEHVDALRSIPNLTVFRPADGLETGMAWAWALERAEGPVALCLTRQGLPPLERPSGFAPRDVWRGAYTVVETDGAPDVVLLASGSEVSIACEAAAKLSSEGTRARVVSLASLELFAELPKAEREAIVPSDGTVVVAVEAGRGESLQRYVGPRGMVYGIQRFGASAPAADLAAKFGFTPDQLATQVREHLSHA